MNIHSSLLVLGIFVSTDHAWLSYERLIQAVSLLRVLAILRSMILGRAATLWYRKMRRKSCTPFNCVDRLACVMEWFTINIDTIILEFYLTSFLSLKQNIFHWLKIVLFMFSVSKHVIYLYSWKVYFIVKSQCTQTDGQYTYFNIVAFS